MNKYQEQAERLDQEYAALQRLFSHFCIEAGSLCGQYGWLSWPDYEDEPSQSRQFSLLGESRWLVLQCRPSTGGELLGHLQIRDERSQVLAALTLHADGRLQLEAGHLLDDPPALLLRLLLAALHHLPPAG
ncbi:hypothetical protein ACET66_11550 [Aeromonas simiae]|uniref:hypothetical protein n=1 Tax=Aeromonas simiae TaxID=218936 RepID=UPI0038CF827E